MTDRIETACGNCGLQSHFLGIVCWWGAAVIALALIAVAAIVLTSG